MFDAFLVSLELYRLLTIVSNDYHNNLRDRGKIVQIIIKMFIQGVSESQWYFSLHNSIESLSLLGSIVLKMRRYIHQTLFWIVHRDGLSK